MQIEFILLMTSTCCGLVSTVGSVLSELLTKSHWNQIEGVADWAIFSDNL